MEEVSLPLLILMKGTVINGNRKVWSLGWKLKNGTWEVVKHLRWMQCAKLYSQLWSDGVREVYIKRTGVSRN